MASILVINDDPVQLHFLAHLLEQDHDDVTQFVSSELAWRWLQEGHVPDAVVLDLHMPEISGWRFCELLQSHFFSVKQAPPVLAVSATYSGVDAESILRDLGASAFLSLPVDPQHFRQAVRRLVESPSRPQFPHIWIISANQSEIQRFQHEFSERGWQIVGWLNAEQVLSAVHPVPPDIVIIDDPLPDMATEDFAIWCKRRYPHRLCVVLGPEKVESKKNPLSVQVDFYAPKGCDSLNLIAICEKGRWERALSRVEHLLDIRTDDLKESEAQFKGLFETLPDVLVIYDQQGIITHMNASGATQLGYALKDLTGMPLTLLLSDVSVEGQRRPVIGTDGGIPEWEEAVLYKKQGTPLPVEMMERVVRFQGQRQTLLIARDLTARRYMEHENATLEHQLRQVQKMEAIGRLASGMAHDLNNILTAILAHASLIKMKAEAGEPLWKAGDVIETAVRRGKELTSQLLGFARQGKHHHIPVDIHDVIQEVMVLLGRTIEKTITFHADCAAAMSWISGDPNQIYQMLMNLAVNACDAMGESGELCLETVNESVTPAQASHVPGLDAGEYVVIRVIDTGSGIPPDIQAHIFEPFFTTKEHGQGTGMGLAMVYGIVKNHHGYIGVSSRPGKGTTMQVYLPSSPSMAPRISPVLGEKPSSGTGRILVVDDEKDVAEAAQAILEYLGYQVTVVLNGKDAVALCQNQTFSVDVILLDMVMTDMSGAECFAQLKKMRPDARVILSTGYDRNHAVQQLLDQGVAGFIQKPYDLKELAHIFSLVIKEERQSEICPLECLSSKKRESKKIHRMRESISGRG